MSSFLSGRWALLEVLFVVGLGVFAARANDLSWSTILISVVAALALWGVVGSLSRGYYKKNHTLDPLSGDIPTWLLIMTAGSVLFPGTDGNDSSVHGASGASGSGGGDAGYGGGGGWPDGGAGLVVWID
ncbi:MAG: hypothetical protein EXR50_08395 [Dehalococcoidia bacterium]|nr:hypothetical protein [Dehalococcoidia bacterium]